jgi:hypothetical protein
VEPEPEENPGVYEISEDNNLLIAEEIVDIAFAFVRKEVRLLASDVKQPPRLTSFDVQATTPLIPP